MQKFFHCKVWHLSATSAIWLSFLAKTIDPWILIVKSFASDTANHLGKSRFCSFSPLTIHANLHHSVNYANPICERALSCFRQLSETKLFLVNSWKTPAETTFYDNSVMKYTQINITMSLNHLKYIFYLKNEGNSFFMCILVKQFDCFNSIKQKLLFLHKTAKLYESAA